MSKEQYTRENFKSSLLKQIIIRVDFSTITDVKGFIMKLKSEPWLSRSFNGYRPIKTNNINLQIDTKTIEDNRFIPIEVKETGTIHRFYDSLIEPIQSTTMDIGSSFICIIIQCSEQYDKIDPYLNIIADTMMVLQQYDNYAHFERFGIRKIDGNDYKNENEAYQTFEKNRFIEDSGKVLEGTLFKQVYTDIFLSEKYNIKVNLTRGLERLNNGMLRFVLDTDGYVDESNFKEEDCDSKDKIISLLKDRINEGLFQIFKVYVTEDFLNKGKTKTGEIE